MRRAYRGLTLVTAAAAVVALGAGSQRLQAQTPAAPVPLTPGAVVLLASKTDSDALQTIRQALAHQDPDVRRAAARVTSVAHSNAFQSLLEALAVERDAKVVTEMVKDAMALGGLNAVSRVEPFALRSGAPAVAEVAEWYARMDPEGFAMRLAVWMRVADGEAHLAPVVQFAIKRRPAARERILAAWKDVASDDGWLRASAPKEEDLEPDVTMRTPVGLAEELLHDTLTAAGCRASGDRIGSARIGYGPDGRPRAIELEASELSAGCKTALTALARISTETRDTAYSAQTLVLPVSSDFLRCVPAPPGPVRLVSAMEKLEGAVSPSLKKEVKPVYTREAMEAQLEGVVELEGVVFESGCLGRVAVTRSLPGLDRQAIRASTRWRFSPGMVSGKPVPVIVNIELTFTLRH